MEIKNPITLKDISDVLKQIVDVLDKQALRKKRVEKLKKLKDESPPEIG